MGLNLDKPLSQTCGKEGGVCPEKRSSEVALVDVIMWVTSAPALGMSLTAQIAWLHFLVLWIMYILLTPYAAAHNVLHDVKFSSDRQCRVLVRPVQCSGTSSRTEWG